MKIIDIYKRFEDFDPATKYKPISKQEAIAIANNADLLDAEEREDFLHLNAYHINDMY